MALIDIPCILMRGGTSRAPYFNAADLPSDRETLAKILTAVLGSNSDNQVDGIGGGQSTTSKVAILSGSTHEWADIDYFFAQVHTSKDEVDFSPSCGNILSGVGPAAVEMGLIEAQDETTSVKIRAVNTGTLVEAIIETPDGKVNYKGEARIDGVGGSAAPVILNFKDVIGSKTGKLFPSGKVIDEIECFRLSCIDVAVPMVIGLAEDFGISGYESRNQLDNNQQLLETIGKLRLLAAKRMGLGDVSNSVIPKFSLITKARNGGSITVRYFMPWSCHPNLAVTGSICLGASLLVPNSITQGIAEIDSSNPVKITIEHAGGSIEVIFDYAIESGELRLNSAGIMRTARRLFKGEVSIPALS